MLKQKIYWKISYIESMRETNAVDSKLLNTIPDMKLLISEFMCLDKHKIKMVKRDYNYGYTVIEEKIPTSEDIYKTYKTKDLVPFMTFKPIQCLSDIEGIPIKDGDEIYKIR